MRELKYQTHARDIVRGVVLWAPAWLLAALCLAPAEATAFCRITTNAANQIGDAPCVEDGAPLTWQRRCLTYAIDSRGSSSSPDMNRQELEAAAEGAISAWTNATCDGTRVDLVAQRFDASTCRQDQFNQTGGNVNTVGFTPMQDPRVFAATFLAFDGNSGRIFDADILVNDNRGPFDLCPSDGCPTGAGSDNPADLQTILTHEFGHFLGIGHSDVVEATMFPSVADRSDTSRRMLAQDDLDAVCTIYPPGSCTQSCAPFPEPFNGLDLNCEDGIASPSGSNNADVCFGGGGGGCAIAGAPSKPSWTGLMFVGAVGLMVWARRRRVANAHASL